MPTYKEEIIQEGKEKRGGIIGNPTSQKPNIKVQGMGGNQTSTSTENTGNNGSQSSQDK